MSEVTIHGKDDLLAEIDDAWTELWRFVDGLQPSELTSATDAAGWTVRDHLAHLAAWERSIDFLLTGRSRHDGLGVDLEIYASGDYDAINASIHERTRHQSPGEVMEELRRVHADTLTILAGMTDADLRKTYSDYAPDEPGEERGEPVLNYVFGNTAHHYQEHLEWMRALVAGS